MAFVDNDHDDEIKKLKVKEPIKDKRAVVLSTPEKSKSALSVAGGKIIIKNVECLEERVFLLEEQLKLQTTRVDLLNSARQDMFDVMNILQNIKRDKDLPGVQYLYDALILPKSPTKGQKAAQRRVLNIVTNLMVYLKNTRGE